MANLWEILRKFSGFTWLKSARFILKLGISLYSIEALLWSAAAPALAAPGLDTAAPTFTVNSPADVIASAPLDNGVCETLPGNHVCTLRAAIMKANHYPGGGVRINLPAETYDLGILPASPDGETSGDLNITGSLTLAGAGAAQTIIDAHQIDRIFYIAPGVSVTISNVTIQNGLVSYVGGGILNNGILTLNADQIRGNQTTSGSAGGGIINLAGVMTLNNTVVSNNQAYGAGGIDNFASLTLNNSIITGNQALIRGIIVSNGGGLNNASTLTMNNSLVSGNQASGNGGGISNSSGTLSITNSTISNNSAAGVGGGIYSNGAALNAYFTTISGNLADNGNAGIGFGGGISSPSGTINLKGVLLGQNYASIDPSDGSGSFNSLDYNLIQTLGQVTLTGTTTHNLTGSDPLLDSARMNGGPTPTRALFTGSPAVNAVPAS